MVPTIDIEREENDMTMQEQRPVFSSDQYKTALKVLEHHDGESGLTEELAEKVNQAWKLEQYAASLGVAVRPGAGEPSDSVGFRLMNKLFEDGWTPPEGVL